MNYLNTYRVVTALVTPFHQEGSLDKASLAKLIKMQEGAGNVILLLGSTGEGLALSLEQKKAVLEAVFALKPTVPVIIGVGGFQLEEQIAWIRYCQENYPVAGFLLVTPLYAKPGVQGQIAWFKALMDSSTLPCIPYNIPGRSAVKMLFPVAEAIKNHPNLLGLKEASGNLEEFSQFVHILNKHLIYSGCDELLKEHLARGGFGVISVASNVWPKETQHYLKLCLQGQNTKAQDALWIEASNALFLASNPIPLKVLLQYEGVIAHATLLPPLTELDLSEVDKEKLCQLSAKIHKELA